MFVLQYLELCLFRSRGECGKCDDQGHSPTAPHPSKTGTFFHRSEFKMHLDGPDRENPVRFKVNGDGVLRFNYVHFGYGYR